MSEIPTHKSVNIAKAMKLWNEGELSVLQIAAHFGVEKGVVSGITHRYRDLFPMKGKPRPFVPLAERVAKAVKEVIPDFSIPKQSTHRQRMERAKTEAAYIKANPGILSKLTDYDKSRLSEAKTLLDRQDHECHWPLNEGGPFIFCAAPNAEKKVYCWHHAKRAAGLKW